MCFYQGLAGVLCVYGWKIVSAVLDPTDQERRLAWKFPDCSHLSESPNNRVDWPNFREELHRHPYPANVDIVQSVLNELRGESSIIDEEARKCFMGVPAVFFYICKFTLDFIEFDGLQNGTVDQDALTKASFQYSVLENYVSVFHPGLVDASNWTITDAEVSELRRRILRLDWKARRARDAIGDRASSVKVYVYEEEEVPQLRSLLRGHVYCSRGQWGAETQIHDFFLTSECRTDDPEEADFFLVPGYSICTLEGNMQTRDEVDEIFKSIVTALPYFNTTAGRDHIFVFVSGMAHSIFPSWEQYIARSIALTPETELFNDFAWIAIPPFQTWRDIVIPGSLDLVEVVGLLDRSKPLLNRTKLAAFFGRVDVVRGPHPWVGGPDVRRDILSLQELPEAGDDLAFGDNATHDIMHAAYGDARFCFVPRGKSGWSLRFFEALFAGCVPVMISDKWELPFEDFLDVTRFVIKWPSKHVGVKLLNYLRSLPDEVVQAYMDEAKSVRCWYFYPPKKFDVRDNVRRMHGVCPEEQGQDVFKGILRILKARRRMSRTAPTSFYFRDEAGQLVEADEDLKALARRAK